MRRIIQRDAGQVGFGVARGLGQLREGQILLQMQLHVVRAVLDLGAELWVLPQAVDPPDKVLVHGVVDLPHRRHILAQGDSLNVAVSHGIGGLRGQAPLNGCPDAAGGRAG